MASLGRFCHATYPILFTTVILFLHFPEQATNCLQSSRQLLDDLLLWFRDLRLTFWVSLPPGKKAATAENSGVTARKKLWKNEGENFFLRNWNIFFLSKNLFISYQLNLWIFWMILFFFEGGKRVKTSFNKCVLLPSSLK